MIAICRNKTRALHLSKRILLLCLTCCSFAVIAETNPARFVIAHNSNAPFADLSTKADFRTEPDPRSDSAPRHAQALHPPDFQAPVRDLKFTHLTTNDGLSQGYVVAILQDRLGFMWFATRDGLNRYDGYGFTVYKNAPEDSGSISNNFITGFAEDKNGDLWVATWGGGLDRFDRQKDRFIHYATMIPAPFIRNARIGSAPCLRRSTMRASLG